MNTVGPTYCDSSDGADRHDTAQRDKRLVDEAMEAYVAWREACTRVNEAFLVWSRRCGFNAGVAFGGYTAALDREERTAACYARVLERVSDVVGAPSRISNRARPARGKRPSDESRPNTAGAGGSEHCGRVVGYTTTQQEPSHPARHQPPTPRPPTAAPAPEFLPLAQAERRGSLLPPRHMTALDTRRSGVTP